MSDGLEAVLAAHVVEVRSEHLRDRRGGGITRHSRQCACGEPIPWKDWDADMRAHLADAIRAAGWRKAPQEAEAIAERLSWVTGEMTRYDKNAHDDHNRWSWRGDGHGEAIRDEFRGMVRAWMGAEDGCAAICGDGGGAGEELGLRERVEAVATRIDEADEQERDPARGSALTWASDLLWAAIRDGCGDTTCDEEHGDEAVAHSRRPGRGGNNEKHDDMTTAATEGEAR